MKRQDYDERRRPTLSTQPAWQATFDCFALPVVVEPAAGQLTSDAGLLPFRQLDQRLGLTEAFAQALHDPRDPDRIEHPPEGKAVSQRPGGIPPGPTFRVPRVGRPPDPVRRPRPLHSRVSGCSRFRRGSSTGPFTRCDS